MTSPKILAKSGIKPRNLLESRDLINCRNLEQGVCYEFTVSTKTIRTAVVVHRWPMHGANTELISK